MLQAHSTGSACCTIPTTSSATSDEQYMVAKNSELDHLQANGTSHKRMTGTEHSPVLTSVHSWLPVSIVHMVHEA